MDKAGQAMNEISHGRRIFDAYCESREGKDYQGEPIPSWHNLRPEIQFAWEVAATELLYWWENEGRTQNARSQATLSPLHTSG